MDEVYAHVTAPNSIVVVSVLGEIELRTDQMATDIIWPTNPSTGQIWHEQLGDMYRMHQEPDFAGFSFRSAALSDLEIDIPYWFVVVLSAALGISPWLTWRFSLRTLVIATALIAFVLGLIVMMEHPHIGFLRPGHPSLPELRGT